MSTEWKPAAYEEGWWRELPENASAWIYRPTEKRKQLNYLVVCVYFRGQPVLVCSGRLSCDDPQKFLPEATRFLESRGLIASDSQPAFAKALELIQPELL